MTGRPESAGNAFTTLRGPTVASVRAAILGTLPDATAGVSDMFIEKSLQKEKNIGLRNNVVSKKKYHDDGVLVFAYLPFRVHM